MEEAWGCWKIGWGGATGNHWGGVNEQRWPGWWRLRHGDHLHTGRGRAQQKTVDFAISFLWERAVPLALTPKIDSSVPPGVFLAPLILLPHHWISEQTSRSSSKSMHGPFKRNAWDCSCPSSRLATLSTGFHSQKLWELLPPALSWGPGCGIPRSSGETEELR